MERVAEKGSHRAGEGEMDSSGRDFDQLLGAAVAKCWGELPQGIQQRIYEHAVGAGCSDDDPLFREALGAEFVAKKTWMAGTNPAMTQRG